LHFRNDYTHLCTDLLVFYAGLEPYDFEDESKRGLYIIGYFEIETSGRLAVFGKGKLSKLFGENQHVKYSGNETETILVKGFS